MKTLKLEFFIEFAVSSCNEKWHWWKTTKSEEECKLTNSEAENDASSDEHVSKYEGPITRSKTKKIEKYISTQS